MGLSAKTDRQWFNLAHVYNILRFEKPPEPFRREAVLIQRPWIEVLLASRERFFDALRDRRPRD